MMLVFVWLTSHSMIISRFIHVAANSIIILFYDRVIFHYMYMCVYIHTYIYITSSLSIHFLVDI